MRQRLLPREPAAELRCSRKDIPAVVYPSDHPGGEANPIVTIADPSGQEIFHTFRVAVVAALPAEAADGAPKK
jgi:hypothetical protein